MIEVRKVPYRVGLFMVSTDKYEVERWVESQATPRELCPEPEVWSVWGQRWWFVPVREDW